MLDRLALPLSDENPGQWIERQAKDLNISVSEICRLAGIDRGLVLRWKRGDIDPRWSTFNRARRAIDSIWERKGREQVI